MPIPATGRAGIDVESAYVRGIDIGIEAGIVAVRDGIAAEQGAPKAPAPASHEPAGLLHDVVGAVLDDLPIDSKEWADRGASLFEGVFLPHQLHDRACDHRLDLRDVGKTCFSDPHE